MQKVEGSSPFTRSRFLWTAPGGGQRVPLSLRRSSFQRTPRWRRGQVVRQGSAKPSSPVRLRPPPPTDSLAQHRPVRGGTGARGRRSARPGAVRRGPVTSCCGGSCGPHHGRRGGRSMSPGVCRQWRLAVVVLEATPVLIREITPAPASQGASGDDAEHFKRIDAPLCHRAEMRPAITEVEGVEELLAALQAAQLDDAIVTRSDVLVELLVGRRRGACHRRARTRASAHGPSARRHRRLPARAERSCASAPRRRCVRAAARSAQRSPRRARLESTARCVPCRLAFRFARHASPQKRYRSVLRETSDVPS